jgi:superfamily II DNA or RNA helicase
VALEAQAIGRVHRLGQKKPVFVTKFVAKGTVEENVLRWNSDKLGTQDGDAAAADGECQLPSSQPTCGMSCVSVCRAVDNAMSTVLLCLYWFWIVFCSPCKVSLFAAVSLLQ